MLKFKFNKSCTFVLNLTMSHKTDAKKKKRVQNI